MVASLGVLEQALRALLIARFCTASRLFMLDLFSFMAHPIHPYVSLGKITMLYSQITFFGWRLGGPDIDLGQIDVINYLTRIFRYIKLGVDPKFGHSFRMGD